MSEALPAPPSRAVLPLLVGTLLLAAALRTAAPGVTYFNIHAARDCHRTLEVISGENFRTHGPELRFGGQTPGWLLYPLMAPPLLVSRHPAGVTLWIGLLATAGVWFTYLIGRDFGGGPRAGLLAALLAAVQVPVILSLRYIWNPCFLPFLTPVVLWCLLQVCVARRAGHFAWLALAWCASASVHFSSYLLLLPILAAFALTRPRVPRAQAITALAIAGVTFGPYALREIRDGFDDLRQIVTSDQSRVQVDDVRPAGERWRLNPNMPIVAAHHVRIPVPQGPFALRESGESQDFTVFDPFYAELDEQAAAPWAIRAVAWLSQVWVPLLLAGTVMLARAGWRHRRGGEEPATRLAAARLIWVLWLALPALVLLFFNFYRAQGTDPRGSVVSFRYFYLLAPAQFLILGWLLDRALARAGRAARWGLIALLGLYALGCAHLVAQFLLTARRTGVVFWHCGWPGRDIYTLGLKSRLVDWLVDEQRLAPADVERRLSGNGIFLTDWWMEDEIDYLLRTHPRIQANAPDPRAPLIRLWPERQPLPGAFPEGHGLASGEVVIEGERAFGPIHATLYRLRDPAAPPPAFNMANRWERMNFD